MPSRLLPLALLAAALPLSAAVAQSRTAVVEIDHATGRSRLIVRSGGTADTTALDAPVVRLDRGTPVEVRVVNTNTALYRFTTESERTPLPEQATLRAFAGRAEPYLPELRAAMRRGQSKALPGAANEAALSAAVAAAGAAIGKVERSLGDVDEALYGRGGLQDLTTTSLLALEQMRRGALPEEASAPLRRAVGIAAPCGSQEPVRLTNAVRLLGALTALVQATQSMRVVIDDAPFGDEPTWREIADSARRLDRRAQLALTDFEPLVDAAYRLERLVGIVANACSSWSAGAHAGSRTQGRRVTVQVVPRGEPELARLVDRAPAAYTVEIQPRPLLRPMLAVAGIAVPGARFPRYGTRGAAGAGDELTIVEGGRKDARFAVGATLGFTWPGLDQREGRGMALWLPEVAVGTGGGVYSFGVGPAVSWGFLKVGVGAMWVRHATLDGVSVGDVLPAGSTVPTSDSYGRPKLHVTLSVIDLASPFDRIRR